MHAKSAIIDGRHLITGSMNWTLAGENKNDENTIIISNSDINAREFLQFFELLWHSIPDRWLHQDPQAEAAESSLSCTDGIDNDFDKLIDGQEISCLRQSTLPKASRQ